MPAEKVSFEKSYFDKSEPKNLHRLLRRSCFHKLQFRRRLLHLVLLLVDEGVVPDRLAHLEVLRLALVVLGRQVLVHVAHLGEGLLADWARVPGLKRVKSSKFLYFLTFYGARPSMYHSVK